MAASESALRERPLGHLLRHTESPCGDATTDGLTEGEHVRFETVLARVPAVARREGVRLVDDQDRTVLTGEGAQRIVETGIGEHYPYVRHRWFGEDAGHVTLREGRLERRPVVELYDAGRTPRLDRRPYVPLTCDDAAVLQGGESLVHGAVVAPVEDQDSGAAGDLTRESDREPVRVRGAQGHLPEREPEALA
jgi:hypothetical protein